MGSMRRRSYADTQLDEEIDREEDEEFFAAEELGEKRWKLAFADWRDFRNQNVTISSGTARWVVYGVSIVFLCTLIVSLLRPHLPEVVVVRKSNVLKKPAGVRVEASVFYGRRQYVDILDCYLQRNLVSNGGFLDQVNFLIHTKDEEDIAWLEDLVASVPGYTSTSVPDLNYGLMWSNYMSREDTIYIKMDDDIVWFAEDAIPLLVTGILNHPEAFAMSGNTINSPEGNWLHYHMGAIYPFAPNFHGELANTTDPTPSWRASSIPQLHESDAHSYPPFELEQEELFVGRTWVGMSRISKHLHKTPIRHAEYAAWGRALNSWAIGAQQHYSLFANIEDGTLDRYFISNTQPWNMQYERYSINFLAVRGKDVGNVGVDSDDEAQISMEIPKRLGKPFLVETRALLCHFSFGPQAREMGKTDLLARYRDYANEMVCAKDNQKKAWPGWM